MNHSKTLMVRAFSGLRETLYAAKCLVTGGGGGFLRHKSQVHARRAVAQSRVLKEFLTNPSLFRANSCPACGERLSPRDHFQNPLGYSFNECPADGTIYMDPVPTDETLARMYNDPSETYFWLRQENPREVAVIAENVDDFEVLTSWLPPSVQGGALLDAGCATGSFLLTARRLFDVEGVDLNDATAETGRAAGLRITTGTLSDLPGAERFDVITMLQVIEHLPNPAEVLRDVRRLLKRDGFLYVNTPNIDSASFKYLKNLHTHVSGFGHVSLFSAKGLELLGKRCGFESVRHDHYGGKDLALHDLLSYSLKPASFRHRMACYSPRFYFACDLVSRLSFRMLDALLLPAGKESYVRMLYRKC